MAQPPDDYDAIAAKLIALYTGADSDLLAAVTRILKQTPATPLGVQTVPTRVRRVLQQVLARLDQHTPPLIRALATAAVTDGEDAADKAVSTALARVSTPAGDGGGVGSVPPGKGLVGAGSGGLFDLGMSHGEHAAQAIQRDLTSDLLDVRQRLTRLPDDIYKAIAPHGAIYQVRDNGVTPAQAQAMAWRVFVSQGVTGFTDRSGRNWALSSYVEMAVRTASQRAFTDSHLERMQALGVKYFTVPDDGHPCPQCFPWQHKVLIDEARPPQSDLSIHVDATIAEARAGGLWHPNCRHTLIPVYPGITEVPQPAEWTQAHADAYKATQRQRALELEIRKAKRAAQYATDPEVRTAAMRDVRKYQGRLRQHIAETGLLRHSRREQINLADDRMKLPDLPRRGVGNAA